MWNLLIGWEGKNKKFVIQPQGKKKIKNFINQLQGKRKMWNSLIDCCKIFLKFIYPSWGKIKKFFNCPWEKYCKICQSCKKKFVKFVQRLYRKKNPVSFANKLWGINPETCHVPNCVKKKLWDSLTGHGKISWISLIGCGICPEIHQSFGKILKNSTDKRRL